MVVKGKPLTIKEQWQKLKNELKDMTPKEKLEHLWTYYKWVLGVLAGMVFVIAVIVVSITSLGQELLLSGAIINVDVDPDGYVMLQDGFFEHIGGREDDEIVELRNLQFQNPFTTTDQTYAMDIHESVVSLVAADGLDYIMLDELAMEFFLDPGLLMDLRQLFTQQQLEDMGSAVIWLQMEDTYELIPIAIDIADTVFYQEHMETDKRICLAFTVTTPRQDACMAFWYYIKGGQTQELKTELAGCAVDVQLEGENKTLLTQGLFEKLGCIAGDHRVELTEQNLADGGDAVRQHLRTGLEEGTLDYVLCTADGLDTLQDAQLLDLGQILTPEELEEMEDALVYRDGVPVAVELPGFGLLAFNGKTERLAACKVLWSLLAQ